MRDTALLSGFVQGLVAGIATLIALAVRAAIGGLPGVTFVDLWTALAVGVAVVVAQSVLAKLEARRMARYGHSYKGRSSMSRQFVTPSQELERDSGVARGAGETDRFDRFTDGARRVLTFAQDEAQRFNHVYIGTEHLLLGLLRQEQGIAAIALENMGIDLARARAAVEFAIGRGDVPVVGEVGLTTRAKRVIELAIDEARGMGHRHIGTEHILLGLVGEGTGIGAGVLESLGASLERTRAEVTRVIERGDDPLE